jgi:hypothetical protein
MFVVERNIGPSTNFTRALASRVAGAALVIALCWNAAKLTAADSSLTWLWGSPRPHGNDVYDMAAANGLMVQVGERGRLYTSLDYETWIPRETHTTKALRGVAFLGNHILITGEAGAALYADASALTNFTLLDLGTTDWLEGVAASARLAVAVGDAGAIYTTSTGTNWTRRPQGFTTWLRSVACNSSSGVFVAVGEGGFIAMSSDGTTWRQRPSGVSDDLNRVVWLTNRFAAVGNSGRVLVSDVTGANWSVIQRNNGPTNDLYAVAGYYGLSGSILMVAGANEVRLLQNNGVSWVNQIDPARNLPAPNWTYYCGFSEASFFLLAGRAGMLVEGFPTNGFASYVWGSRVDSVRNWLWDVARFPGLYVAVGDLGTVETSNNGAEWDYELVPEEAAESVFLGVGGRPDLMLAVGAQGSVILSTNSVIWTALQPRPTTNDLQGVATLGGLVVVTGGAGTILTSTDGYQWTNRANPATGFLSSVAAYPGGLVAVGESGTVLNSPDGLNWTAGPALTTNWLYRVRYLNGQLITVGQNGALFTSPDGRSWTPRASGTTCWLTDAAALEGVYYAVGTQGAVLASTNGITWSSLGTITQKSLFAAAADTFRHQLVTVGIEGAILRAQPGPLAFLQYAHAAGTNSFAISGTPGRKFTLERSSDLATWTNLATLELVDNSGEVVFEEERTNAPPTEFYRAALLP